MLQFKSRHTKDIQSADLSLDRVLPGAETVEHETENILSKILNFLSKLKNKLSDISCL